MFSRDGRNRASIQRLCVIAVAAIWTGSSTAWANDLAPLTDKFESATTLAAWSRVHLVEQWNADQLETFDINTTRAGRMVMMPYVTSWYENYRGPLAFQEVTGDFVITTELRATGRDGTSVPQSQYSLAGIMVRTPRNITPQTWTPATAGICTIRRRVSFGRQPPTSR